MATSFPYSESVSSNNPRADKGASQLCILIVEDNIETAEMIRQLLEHDGYQVVELTSGVEALDLIAAVERGEAPPFDLALLDIMMPQVNGYEVCQEIRRTEPLGYIPIIMVTALNAMDDMVRGLDLGADDYLVKPFNPKELLARVRAALRIRDVERTMRRRNWHLAMLNALSDAISGSLDADEVLRAGVSQITQRLDLAYAVVFLLDRRTDSIARMLHYAGDRWTEERIPDPADTSDGTVWQGRGAYRLAREVIMSGRRRLQTEARGWPSLPSVGGARPGWRACVSLKIESPSNPGSVQARDGDESSGRVLGALLVGAPAERPAVDLNLLTAVGNQIGQALEKCHFYQQARNRGEGLAALYRMSQAINSSLDLSAILTAAMESVRKIVPVEAGSLLLLDDSPNQAKAGKERLLTFVRTVRQEDAPLISRQIPVGQGIVGQSVLRGQPLIVNDVRADPHFIKQFDQMTGFATRSVLCVPLRVRDRVIGALELINKINGPFDDRDLELAGLLAATVGGAVENGRLFHDLSAAYDNLDKSRRAILASRNQLQALFDSISDTIYVVDGQYRIVALNAALRQWLVQSQWGQVIDAKGWPESAVGQICYRVLYGRETPCENCQVWQTLQNGERAQWADQRRRSGPRQGEASGSREVWEISTYPIQGWQDRTSQAIVFARDVTEQRMLEASLSQSEKLASLGQLAAGLAHEINNPLTAIEANTQLLLMDTPPDDPDYESLELIKLAADRAVKVMRNLLDFARQEQYAFQPTDLNASLRAALELVRHQFLIAKVKVFEDLAANLPTAMASRDHLQGVWLNLLLNARDAVTHHAKADGERCVWVRSRLREDGLLEVTIRDNGAGIPPEQLNRIFEPFFTTKDPGKGTGLGLSTSYHIIKQHGGEIRADSQVGEGAIFTVLLPTVAQ